MRLPSTFIALVLTTGAFAQSTPPKIPPAGITLPDADRAELTAGTEALQKEITQLTRKLSPDPELLALLPDVEIFHKAVAWSLADNTIYSPQEIAFAKHLLSEGQERAKQLSLKKSPWLAAKGLIVRGYRSKIDNSVQPYGLVVPEDLDLRKPVPLMVWLLGRGEKRTELAFLAEREGGPPQLTPKGTITVIPYGRFCNATKFAGETDVMEALAAVRARYEIDPQRIAVAGFSMGGGSTWHLATHFPGLWCAASPGAGFAETPIFTKASDPGKEARPAWEQTLWRQYEATGISQNLSNVPTLAYSGETDGQKEASDLMEAAMAKENLKLERFIGPKTGHQYHPETKAELTARLEESIAKGREPSPSSIRFSTYTLRYPECAWFRIDRLGEHWQRADASARRSANGDISLDLKNITAFTIRGVKFGSVSIGGRSIPNIPVSTEPHHFVCEEGVWKTVGSPPATDKRPGLTGPVDDAFMDSFVFVRPTGQPFTPALGRWVSDELAASRQLWHDVFRGEVPVVDDSAVSDNDIANKNLILWGDPSSNRVIAKILPKLPLHWTRENIIFRDRKYDGADHAPILVFPNPLNPDRYVVLNSGIDFRADGYGNNALQTPKLPDWAIVDLSTPPGPRWPGKIETAGFFNEQWK
ncbi:prolyl oligopeptidase family serine peptidase [Luteolibacter yonseiensis]|uniref:Prolyl oligopeptidase family serine peptidase n=1 Tax=Luteolibacter yonseiensis TaxID=1144680 RepID=A0A934R551_9BACT|nr:prolyl oligopeptidase family serine peptidase [Luteolibacter yonseiensis]MBK1816557.1 prolyl oligopeptidase family serine peptidase [Luteolibacter yonseiensis]